MGSGPVRLGDIAAMLGGEVVGDPQVPISQVATLRGAAPGGIAFFSQSRHRSELALTQASAVIVGAADRDATALPRIVCADPYAYFARVSALFNPPAPIVPGVHASAVVARDASVAPSARIDAGCVVGSRARVGDGASLGAGCIVGEGASIGPDVRLHPRVTVYAGCEIGARSIVHSGAVIGADGFGFAPEGGKWLKIPQVGRVRVGADVEIGANTTIDRGAIEDTVIEDGVKLDNQIQIGHNCRVGAHTAIAGCVGIAGSTTIGRHCMIGGAAMIGGHLTIADRVIVAGSTVVTKSIDAPGTYLSVIPAEEAREWRRIVAHLRGLARVTERLRDLERRIRHLEREE
jgi:UDP-3-O-[3-hydroxymyristoyl] glucosamine N-acyltransferase